jgi:hypothetical protein
MVSDCQKLDETDMQGRKYAMDTAIKLMQMADEEEQTMRSERTKRGLNAARDAMLNAGTDENPRVLKMMLKAIVGKLGPEETKALIAPLQGETIDA